MDVNCNAFKLALSINYYRVSDVGNIGAKLFPASFMKLLLLESTLVC